ncbi:hypothetical protein [Streptomyces sp. cg35]|uniref:hypothetical protein n=1 Tax=Streptomyces sp. cg35 TaxID=3421650 RepID=UPI003D17FBF0
MTEVWSYLLTAVGVLGIALAGRKQQRGWLVSLCAQGLWAAYAVQSHQYGFLLSSFIYGYVYADNYARWRRGNHASVTEMREAAEQWEQAKPLLEAMLRAHRVDLFHAKADEFIDEAERLLDDTLINSPQRTGN